MGAFETFLSIAEIPCRITSDNERTVSEIEKECREFLTKKNSKMQLNLVVENIDSIEDFVFLDKGILKFGQQEQLVFLANHIIIKSDTFFGKFDLQKSRGKFFLFFPKKNSWFVLRNLLKICYSLQLIEKNGFLLHSTAISKNDKGYVFTGPQESGKSTIAKFSKKFRVLNDEYPAIRKINGRTFVFGTPFGGDFKQRNEKAAIDKTFIISKSKKNRFQKIGIPEGVNKILPNEFLISEGKILAKNSKKTYFKILNALLGCLGGTGIYKMHFKKDNSFWKEIEKLG